MKILILGSEGFIGHNLVQLFKKNQDVAGCDLFERPSSDYRYYKVSRLSPEWEEILSASSFDVCINAAGSGNVPYSMSHPLGDFESNTLDVIRVLDAIRRFNKSCRYLHISSAAVYGNPQQLPVKETDSLLPLSPYGWHKWMSELVCREYCQLYGIASCIVRPFSVYGPGLRKQLFWDLYRKAIENTTVELFGTGNESRDFIYIDDLAKSLSILLEKAPMKAECYNLASGAETSIQKAASLFLQHFSGLPQLLFNGQIKPGDPLNWRADISKISALGFEPATPLDKGLQLTHAWINGQMKEYE